MSKRKAFNKDIKVTYMMNYVKLAVALFLTYNKHYDITKMKFNHILNESMNTGMILDEDDMKIMIKHVKELLYTQHGIEIINDNPIKISKRY